MKKLFYTKEMINQFRKPISTLYEYLPTRFQANEREWKVRKFVWAFKNGEFSDFAANAIAKRFKELFQISKDVAFVCIPASSNERNIKRYKEFSETVCKITGAVNAFDAIKIEGEKLAIHETVKGDKEINSCEIITFDKEFFKGKKVVVFDDVITKGYTYARFAAHLEKLGAEVMGALFLAKTIVH